MSQPDTPPLFPMSDAPRYDLYAPGRVVFRPALPLWKQIVLGQLRQMADHVQQSDNELPTHSITMCLTRTGLSFDGNQDVDVRCRLTVHAITKPEKETPDDAT